MSVETYTDVEIKFDSSGSVGELISGSSNLKIIKYLLHTIVRDKYRARKHLKEKWAVTDTGKVIRNEESEFCYVYCETFDSFVKAVIYAKLIRNELKPTRLFSSEIF